MNGDLISVRNFVMVGLMAYLFIYLLDTLFIKLGKPQFAVT